MPGPKKSFSPEFKDEAVKMVIETSRPIARVAKELVVALVQLALLAVEDLPARACRRPDHAADHVPRGAG